MEFIISGIHFPISEEMKNYRYYRKLFSDLASGVNMANILTTGAKHMIISRNSTQRLYSTKKAWMNTARCAERQEGVLSAAVLVSAAH